MRWLRSLKGDVVATSEVATVDFAGGVLKPWADRKRHLGYTVEEIRAAAVTAIFVEACICSLGVFASNRSRGSRYSASLFFDAKRVVDNAEAALLRREVQQHLDKQVKQ